MHCKSICVLRGRGNALEACVLPFRGRCDVGSGCFDESQCHSWVHMRRCQKSWQGQHFVSCSKRGGSVAKFIFFDLCENGFLSEKNSQESIDFHLHNVQIGGKLARNAHSGAPNSQGGRLDVRGSMSMLPCRFLVAGAAPVHVRCTISWQAQQFVVSAAQVVAGTTFCDGVVVFVWLCLCGGGGVLLWWCGSVVVFLWLCVVVWLRFRFCGGEVVFCGGALVFLWWCGCVFVVVCWCFCVFVLCSCDLFVIVVLFLLWFGCFFPNSAAKGSFEKSAVIKDCHQRLPSKTANVLLK